MTLEALAKDLTPPIFMRALRGAKALFRAGKIKFVPSATVSAQDLNFYWEEKMAVVLDQWGQDTVWNEIQFLLANCSGRVLDIACGTGKAIEINSANDKLELYGCDISDLLIGKALERGISRSRLKVCDATHTDYVDDQFDYAYSIGSLEHFTETGIHDFLQEAKRIVRHSSFHMIPVSAIGKDEGWLKTTQSYHNNTVDWWKRKFAAVFPRFQVLDSSWKDDISVGKWFICSK
jgi:ubiquinone/menaquinone biosynthesis C-methylase UbiE